MDNFCDSPILNIYLTNAKTKKKKHFLLYMDQSTEAEKQSLWGRRSRVIIGFGHCIRKSSNEEEEDGGEDRKGDRKEYYPSKRLRFASQYLFSFRFSYGKHPASLLVATASQKGYQRLAAFFSDHPKILWSSTGERGDIFLLRGGLDACSHAQHSIETAFRHKFIR